MIRSVARRYAKALFALARDQQALDQTATEIHQISSVTSDAATRAVLANPMLTPSKRRQLAELILGQAKPSDMTCRFVRLLADRQRLEELPGVAREYQRLLDQHLGRAQLTVRSSQALPEAQQQEIIAAFGRLTGKTVVPSFVIDPDLLGGVVVEAEGKVYDGSIKTQLERLATQLGGAAH